MKLNELSNNHGAKKVGKRLGRGIGSGKGKTCGKGVKGQKARAGVAIKGFEGGQTPLKKRLPKRGFNCPSRREIQIINLVTIDRLIEKYNLNSSVVINKQLLIDLKAIKDLNKPIKILANKSSSQFKFSVIANYYSESAKRIIENSGGRAIYEK